MARNLVLASLLASSAALTVQPVSLVDLVPHRDVPSMSERGARAMALHEVGSEQLYRTRYNRPIYPGGSSGPTIGIGYDLGTQTARTIEQDWRHREDEAVLGTASGLLGAERARPWVNQHRYIRVTWEEALVVYRETLLPRYYNQARMAFGPGFEEAPQGVKDALVSLVYNRGPSMRGPSRVEMRIIRDECLPHNRECVAIQLEAMCRIWRGTELETGLCRRRYHEAEMARTW